MEKLSGLVLDPGDDYNGEVLRSLFASPNEVPQFIKMAEHLTPERREQLPDEVFAVVLQDGDLSLRKYAMTDAGNTALSTLYFLRNGHKLPVEAQKVAAARLCEACEWYNLDVPLEMKKVALGLGTVAHLAVVGPGTVKGTARNIKKNMAEARASGGDVNPGVIGGPIGVRGL
jgi:hypothetical protein